MKTSTVGSSSSLASLAREGRGGKGMATTNRLSASIMTLYISAE